MTTPSTVDEALAEASTKMDKAVAVFKEDLAAIRTGRASPALVQKLEVDYYGAQVPLNQLASFSVPEPRLLVIQPFDRNAIAAIEKAILGSDLGITPSNDGQIIRLAFPPLTEERRKELIKLVHHRAEEARSVRRHDKEALERLEREGTISEDELRRAEKELQRLTDQHVAEIDEIQRHKEQELREIA